MAERPPLSTQVPRADATSALRRHWRAAASVTAVAALLHMLALSGLQWAWPRREPAPQPAQAMQVRILEAPLSDALADALPPRAAKAPQSARRPLTTAAPGPARVPAGRPAPGPARIEPVTVEAVAVAVAEPAPAAEWAAPADAALPLYATLMPPAMRLHYQVRRGGLQGTGDLLWRPQGERYELYFDARIGPLNLLSQASTGGFDAAGIAPLRFTDQRLRRSLQAVNFQRESGKVSFSGRGTEFPLYAGMQDRLSWMLQLAAIVAAEPALRVVGAKVVLRVVGAQGDVSVWALRCLGGVTATDTAGAAEDGDDAPSGLLTYLREPREPYDTTVKVWLDPARHHLPVRARLKAGPGDPGLSMVLQDMQPLP